MVLLSISSSSFGNYFGMADKLCTICLFFIISSRPNNEIIDECKSEDKIIRILQIMDINKVAEKTSLHCFPEKTKGKANVICREFTLDNKSEFQISPME